MSKLLDKIEKASQERPRHMGFGPVTQERAIPLPLLIGVGTPGTAPLSDDLARHLDGVLFRLEGTQELEALTTSEGMPPWGVWMDTPTPELMASLKERGGDFLLFSPESVPIELLQEGEVGKLLLVPLELSDRLAPALQDLPVDAVAVTLAQGTSLTVHQLMIISGLRGFFGKPFLMSLAETPNQAELEVLRDSSVEGILLDVAAIGAEAVKEVRARIDALPPRKPTFERGRATAVLPRIPASGGGRVEEEEEEDEEPDDF